MKKLSIRKISILSLVLLTASAVTAAVVSDKTGRKTNNLAEGSLTLTSDNEDNSSITCNPDSNSNISQQACTATSELDGSGTTTMPNNSTPGTSNNGNESDEDDKDNNTTDYE